MSAPRAAVKGKAGVAAAVCLIAWLGLLPAQVGAAQDRNPSPSPDGLWKAYPLAPTAEPGTQPKAASSPAASTRTRPAGAARTDSEGGAQVFILVLLALATAGGMLTFAGVRRRREREPAAAAAPLPSRPTSDARPDPPLWRGPADRFSRSVTRTPATAMVAPTERPDGMGSNARDNAGDDLSRQNGPAGRAGGGRPPVTPIVAPAPVGAPPEPGLSWTAEIEWRQIRGQAHFCVVARGAGTVEVAQSAALVWPPDGPAEVQAVADAVDELTATLVAAGWKTLPPGTAWYAKRFAWEPAQEALRPSSAEGPQRSPSKSAGAKRVAPPRRPTPPAPSADDSGAGSRRSRAKAVALLGVLAIVGLIIALQGGDGSDDGRQSAPSGGTDLTIPLIVIVSVVFLVLLIREMRRTSR